MSGLEAAFWVVLAAVVSLGVGVVIGIRLEQSGKDIDKAVRDYYKDGG